MVKKGYKQTEVGVIPEDWECVKIKDVATISMCKRIFANQTSTIGDVPFYKIGTFGKEADAYISSKLYVEYRNKYSFPQKGNILISAAGTLGRTVVYDGEKAYFQDSNIVWLDINKTRLCNEYLNQYYKVIKWASSEGSTIARVYNGIIYATYISLPPLPEQQRIAEALSDVDGMISSLEKLIAKYKSIKTACLQQMFPQNGETVPRMRLPGFTGAWEQRKLGDISGVYDGVHQTPFYTDSGIMFLSVENIGTLKSNKYISEEAFNRDYKVYPQKGDILMTRIGDVGTPNVVETSERVAFYVSLALLKPSNVDSYFLCNSILSPFFQSGLKERTLITAIPQKINKDEIGNVRLFLPSSTDEQVKIGVFFQQLDNLITLHQRKLEKIQKIKQGMMQQLLTGKIRLV